MTPAQGAMVGLLLFACALLGWAFREMLQIQRDLRSIREDIEHESY